MCCSSTWPWMGPDGRSDPTSDYWHGAGSGGERAAMGARQGETGREPGRPTPEQMLARVRKEEAVRAAAVASRRPRLRVYLGMAPGVGKTYDMLAHGQRQAARGVDVVVGFVETHDRAETAAQLVGLEVVPRLRLPYRGVIVEEMDIAALIARRPELALIDELAHTNAPGSPHEKRYEDVLQLIESGIGVVTTVNIQHLESLNDIVRQITGVAVHETVPDWVIDRADEIELVDVTPEMLHDRLREGLIYPPDRAEQALGNFFREGNLTALRELALRRTAQAVERRLEAYMREHDLEGWATTDRVLVCVDERAIGRALVRRGWRIATATQGQLVVAHVARTGHPRTAEADARLAATLRLAEDLGAEVVALMGEDVAQTLARYAHEHNVSQIVIGHSSHGRWYEFLRGSIVNRLSRATPEIDVLLVAEGEAR